MNRKFSSFGVTLFLSVSCLAAQQPGAASPQLDPAFYAVLRSGDTARLSAALDRGASIDARDAAGNTPLILAAAYGDASAMRLLLERGAAVDATNNAGATPLLRAATDGAKVELLLSKGANANARSVLGNTPLMLAARPANSHRAVALLLEHGADARATNNWGATALMAAAAGGDAQSVRLLLKHGAEVNAHPKPDHDSFVLGGGRSALMWAAFRGDTEIMRILLDAGADANAAGFLGSPLSQAAWGDHTAAAQLLIERGAKVNQADPGTTYTPLHWAASTENSSAELVQFLLSRGADPNAGGGENVGAFMGAEQTPLMIARRRGETPVLAALVQAGATNTTPDRPLRERQLRAAPEHIDTAAIRTAVGQAIPPLQKTSIESKQSFLRHASRQDCVSCHQQMLPLAAVASARKIGVSVDAEAEAKLLEMVRGGELKNNEPDWEALFHPEAVHSKGYALLGLAAEDVAPDEATDAWVHHLASIQGKDGQWHNNLPRPPIQTGDIGATALAVHALQHFAPAAWKHEFAQRVERARHWLWNAQPDNTEGRAYQLLGLAWSGEPSSKLQALAAALIAEQRPDGGWAQLSGLATDTYATGQVVYALRVAAGMRSSQPAVEQGLRYLLTHQIDDGTWHVRRRAFPFQPTMDSGFPHGRDSWISATASSWAVMALAFPEGRGALALK